MSPQDSIYGCRRFGTPKQRENSPRRYRVDSDLFFTNYRKGMVLVIMEENMEYTQKLMEEYKEAAGPLMKYLPWLEQNAGKAGNSFYKGPEFTEHSMAIPVFDSNLMSFVKEAGNSPLMDRNYPYTYTRNRIKTHDDERKIITRAGIRDWNILKGILSKYVLGGRTKGLLWSEGLQENIFYLILKQMQQIIEYWDKPADIE